MSRSAVAVLALLLVACSDARGRRTWRVSDHAQPEGVGAAAPTSSRTVSPEDARLQAGAALFRMHCVSCHGARGRGDGSQVPPSMSVPDLTTLAARSTMTDAQIAAVVRAGRGAMPPFGMEIDEPGIAALVAHVRSLAAPVDAPTAPPETP